MEPAAAFYILVIISFIHSAMMSSLCMHEPDYPNLDEIKKKSHWRYCKVPPEDVNYGTIWPYSISCSCRFVRFMHGATELKSLFFNSSPESTEWLCATPLRCTVDWAHGSGPGSGLGLTVHTSMCVTILTMLGRGRGAMLGLIFRWKFWQYWTW